MNKLEFDRVAGLARLLYSYRDKVPKDDDHTFDISEEDRPVYDAYFQELILPGVLPDGTAFGASSNDDNLGVGKDARAFRAEYYQLLMQCYRYLYMALSAGEVFLEPSGWVTADKASRPVGAPQEET